MKSETYRGIDLKSYELVWEIIQHYQSLGMDLLDFSDKFVCGYRDGYEKGICDFKAQMARQIKQQTSTFQ